MCYMKSRYMTKRQVGLVQLNCFLFYFERKLTYIFRKLALLRKEEGNKLYAAKDYKEAIKLYSEAIGKFLFGYWIYSDRVHSIHPHPQDLPQLEGWWESPPTGPKIFQSPPNQSGFLPLSHFSSYKLLISKKSSP